MNRRTVNGALLGVPEAAAFLGGSERWLRRLAVHSSRAKNGKSRTLSLNSLVREALDRLPKKSEWVFTKPNGTPYTAVRGFHAACQETGFTDVALHTLRCLSARLGW